MNSQIYFNTVNVNWRNSVQVTSTGSKYTKSKKTNQNESLGTF